jgi:hypothetical protein
MVEPDAVYAVAARAAWSELLVALAHVLRAFGALLHAEVKGTATAEEDALTQALDRLRRRRERYADILLARPPGASGPVGARRCAPGAGGPDAAGARHRRPRAAVDRAPARDARSASRHRHARPDASTAPPIRGARDGRRRGRPGPGRTAGRRARASTASGGYPVTAGVTADGLLAEREARACSRFPRPTGAGVGSRPCPAGGTTRSRPWAPAARGASNEEVLLHRREAGPRPRTTSSNEDVGSGDVRLTVAQALVRFLANHYSERDGVERRNDHGHFRDLRA